MLIDVHSHVVPAHFPDNPAPDAIARWPCLCHDERGSHIAFGGRPFRDLDTRSWSVPRRLADMDREGIAAQVLSPMPELLSYWLPAAPALDLARHVNDCIAAMVAAAPGRFHGFGTVPLQDVDMATRELERLRDAGLRGVEIGSNINGAYPGDAGFAPFLAECERLDLALFVHALHPPAAECLAAWPELVPYAAFPLDTGLACATLVRAGVLERHPRLRLCFSHGGGAFATLLHRLDHGWRLSEGFGGNLPQPPSVYARRCFVDSLVYDTALLDHLAGVFGPGQVVAGTDYPYAIQQKGLAGFLEGSRYCAGDATTAAARRLLGLPSM